MPVATRHLAFSKDGLQLRAGQVDGVTLVWPLAETEQSAADVAVPSDDELQLAWSRLAWGRDTSRGNAGHHERINALVAGGDATIEFLTQVLLVADPAGADEAEVQELLKPLVADSRVRRANAAKELKKFGDRVRASLPNVEDGPPQASQLEGVTAALREGARYRRANAVYYVIRQIGTPQAQQLLQALSEQLPDEAGKRPRDP